MFKPGNNNQIALGSTTDYGVQTVIRLGGTFTKHLNEGT